MEKTLRWILDNLDTADRGALQGQLDDCAQEAEATRNRFALRKIQIARVLFQDSSEFQQNLSELVAEVNGVSEPATVPHQTPEAGVTPRGGQNGKS